MAAQNKPSPSADPRRLALLLRLAPPLAASAWAAALGYISLPLIPARTRAYLLIPFLALFLALTILDREQGWNLVLLVGFSFTAGILLNWSGSDASQGITWLLFLGLVTVSWIGAQTLGTGLQKWLQTLFPLTVLYLLGWLGIIFWDIPGWIRGLWILVGLALFTAVAASALQRGLRLEREESPLPLAIELAVILINLFWFAGWISPGW